MQQHTNFDNANRPPELPTKATGVNIGDTAPLAPEAMADLIFSKFGAWLTYVPSDNSRTYVEIGDSNACEMIWVDNYLLAESTSGRRTLTLSIDRGTVGTDKNSEGKLFETRVHRITRAPSGEPVFCQSFISAWQFVKKFRPSETWLTATQWAKILQEIQPELDLDEAAEIHDTQARLAREEQSRQARASQLNPQAELGKAIAAGVVEALRAMNIKPAKA